MTTNEPFILLKDPPLSEKGFSSHCLLLSLLLLLVSGGGGLAYFAYVISESTSTAVSEPLPTPIKHVVVLMLENRAFDHVLGWLKEDFSESIDGIKQGMSCPLDPNDLSKGSVLLNRDAPDVSPDDPFHDYNHIDWQINKGAMNGFVNDSLSGNLNFSNPISMFDSISAPILNTLAKEYAVFDTWFSSVPGPTDPNRAFALSGTSNGTLDNYLGAFWTQQSYFDYLRVNGRSFRAYYQRDPWAIMYFEDMHHPANSVHIFELDNHFYHDVAAGNLADFTWLQPSLSAPEGFAPSWQHPSAPMVEGERLIKNVYEALRNGPAWNSTLFLITYDEHGGFYDHVSPPSEGVPSPDGRRAPNGFNFDRLGVRIPMVAVSPWIERGSVVSAAFEGEQPTPLSQFESTSVMATTNMLLNVKAENLGKRTAWANTFMSLVKDRDLRTNCLSRLPSLAATPPHVLAIHRSKPPSDAVRDHLILYCQVNDPANMSCSETVLSNLNTQGIASDWMQTQHDIFFSRLRASAR